jgi:UPF0042 nucleotide-binding protein
MIKIKSFSYKREGSLAHRTGDVVIDCRALPNPHSVPELKELTGRDGAVQDYVKASIYFGDLMKTAERAVEAGRSVAFGCVGGRHRSVALAELTVERLREAGYNATVEHTALSLS